MPKKKVLFLCVSNSCRSQLAEGWARRWGQETLEPYSAGQKATFVQPKAIEVMKEKGVDLSAQFSKTIEKIPVNELDYIITLCAEGADYCPTVPGPAERIHWPIDDPAKATGSEEEILQDFRRARDEIEGKVKSFIEGLA